MRWQCTYVYASGVRCTAEAVWRLHFSDEHPFDHVDVCEAHRKEYKYVAWIQCWKEDVPPELRSKNEPEKTH